MILNARESGRTKSLFPDRWSLVDRHNGVSASGLCLALGDSPAALTPEHPQRCCAGSDAPSERAGSTSTAPIYFGSARCGTDRAPSTMTPSASSAAALATLS